MDLSKMTGTKAKRKQLVAHLNSMKTSLGWEFILQLLQERIDTTQAVVNSINIKDMDKKQYVFNEWQAKVKLKYMRDLIELPDDLIKQLSNKASKGGIEADPYS